jgi:uncharacterized membrane protein YhhN
MQEFLNKRIILIYWMVLAVHLVFQYFVLPYRAVTKPMLVPLLLTYLLLKDGNIGKPTGKAFFYIGLFLAFFGDVLLILINDTFFLSGMIAFMLMNVFYSISFLHLSPFRIKKSLPFFITLACLAALALWIYGSLAEEMGDYRMPVMIYLFSLVFMIGFAINITINPQHRKTAFRFLIPGAVIFMIENILVAVNMFHLGGNKDVYIAVMVTYGIAQYLIVMGMREAYPPVAVS